MYSDNKIKHIFMEAKMAELTRITFDSKVMGGKPCIRGMRVTVGTIVGLLPLAMAKMIFCISTPISNRVILTKRLPMPHGASRRLTSLLYRNPHEIVDRHEPVPTVGAGT